MAFESFCCSAIWIRQRLSLPDPDCAATKEFVQLPNTQWHVKRQSYGISHSADEVPHVEVLKVQAWELSVGQRPATRHLRVRKFPSLDLQHFKNGKIN